MLEDRRNAPDALHRLLPRYLPKGDCARIQVFDRYWPRPDLESRICRPMQRAVDMVSVQHAGLGTEGARRTHQTKADDGAGESTEHKEEAQKKGEVKTWRSARDQMAGKWLSTASTLPNSMSRAVHQADVGGVERRRGSGGPDLNGHVAARSDGLIRLFAGFHHRERCRRLGTS